MDYLVLLELPYSPNLEQEFEQVKAVLTEELRNSSQAGDSCQANQTLCFKPDSVKVNNNTGTVSLSPQAICRRAAAEGYEDFYFAIVAGSSLRCVSNCTAGLDFSLDCNQGQCVLERSGPACRCFYSDTYWYSGPRCEVAVPWKALIGGLAGAGALLLLLLLVLGVYAVRGRRHRLWDEDKQWLDVWNEDATEGTFTNSGLKGEGASNQGDFQVALDTIDPNMQVHIQRPEVASTWM